MKIAECYSHLNGYEFIKVHNVVRNRYRFSMPLNPPGWAVQLNYWLAMAVSIALVLGLAYLMHALLIRRFSDAPRLILTVFTIGLASVYAVVQTVVVNLFGAAQGAGTWL